jgi:polar amino acid transport system substrate-binding protein
MRWVTARFCTALLLLCSLTPALLSRAAPATNAPLKVVVREIEPFAFSSGGRQAGFAVDLWAAIAKEAGFDYELQTVGSAQAMVQALAARQADIGLGALSITAEREQVIDFSYPFYNSGLDIVTGTQGGSVFGVLRVLFKAPLIKTLGLLLVLVLVFSHLLWLFERRVNEEEFPPGYKAGLFESLWWTMAVLITLGCENKSPRGVPGRLMAIIWMASGVLMISLITASFASSLTVSTLEGKINGPSDLAGHKVATVTGSTAEAWLNKARNVTVQGYPDIAAAVSAVSKGDAVAAVYDEPILRYQLAKYEERNVRLVGILFEKQGYGFGLQLKSPYQKTINQTLLKLIENNTVDELQKKWFGDAAAEKR